MESDLIMQSSTTCYCIDGYYYDSNKKNCYVCDALCYTCNNTATYCQSCKQTKNAFLVGNACVCNQGYYLISLQSECVSNYII